MSVVSRLLFARHGNTFGPHDPVVWVGAGTDLPLVARGEEQAHAAAQTLRMRQMVPSQVIAASLKRTQSFAKIICDDLGLSPPLTHTSLNEIHYGAWEGDSTEAMAADPARAQALNLWQQSDIWPDALGWQTSEVYVKTALSSLLAQGIEGHFGLSPLFVSSNGILRFAPRLLGVEKQGSFQLKTGQLGCLERSDCGWQVTFWGDA